MSSQYTFSNIPRINIPRSRFDLSHGVKMTASVGTLYPVDVQPVVPGDTFKCVPNFVIRATNSFLKPVMDNLFIDVRSFFVPSRLVYDKFPEVFGENNQSAWKRQSEVTVPVITSASTTHVYPGSVGDYLGIPPSSTLPLPSGVIQILPFRCFALIWNEFYRDENVIAPMNIQKGSFTSSERPNNNAWAPNNYVGKLPKVSKFHDLWTSCLPEPQKGDAVTLPLSSQSAPIVTDDGSKAVGVRPYAYNDMSTPASGTFQSHLDWIANTGDGYLPTGNYNVAVNSGGAGYETETYAYASSTPFPGVSSIYPGNLGLDVSKIYADLSSVVAQTVAEQRYAFALQKQLECDARSGNRYTEKLSAEYGVSNPDGRLQRPEFLGGKRVPLSLTQVATTIAPQSATDSPLASVGAYSLSAGQSRWTKSFTEFGYIITVACIRPFHSYQQGLERFWTETKRQDFYSPYFAHIGEQPVYKSTLYMYGNNAFTTPFGYNEAWADMRSRPTTIKGQMRSGVTNSLDVWHFADNYASEPTLNSQFIEETPTNVDRTLAVNSSTQDQFICDFYFNCLAYRPLPTYSVPGLIDHP